jgi:hypothetical protein
MFLELIKEVHGVNAGLRSRRAAVNLLAGGRLSRRATSIKLQAISFAGRDLQIDQNCRVPVSLNFNQAQIRERTLQRGMARRRAGKPEPPFGFVKLTTTIAPTSGT